jgi:hypothetical protein
MNAPVKVRQELPRVVRFDPRAIKAAVGEVEGFNAKLALVITRSVGQWRAPMCSRRSR